MQSKRASRHLIRQNFIPPGRTAGFDAQSRPSHGVVNCRPHLCDSILHRLGRRRSAPTGAPGMPQLVRATSGRRSIGRSHIDVRCSHRRLLVRSNQRRPPTNRAQCLRSPSALAAKFIKPDPSPKGNLPAWRFAARYSARLRSAHDIERRRAFLAVMLDESGRPLEGRQELPHDHVSLPAVYHLRHDGPALAAVAPFNASIVPRGIGNARRRALRVRTARTGAPCASRSARRARHVRTSAPGRLGASAAPYP